LRDLPGDHSDGIQMLFGLNCVLSGNAIHAPAGSTSCMILHGNFGPVSVTVANNLFDGGGYSLNMKHRNTSLSGQVHNNVFAGPGDLAFHRQWYPADTSVNGFGTFTGDALPSGSGWTGNTFLDGTPIVR
jgi:hypothetical protein